MSKRAARGGFCTGRPAFTEPSRRKWDSAARKPFSLRVALAQALRLDRASMARLLAKFHAALTAPALTWNFLFGSCVGWLLRAHGGRFKVEFKFGVEQDPVCQRACRAARQLSPYPVPGRAATL